MDELRHPSGDASGSVAGHHTPRLVPQHDASECLNAWRISIYVCMRRTLWPMLRSRHMGYTSVCTVCHVAVCGNLDRSLLVLPVRTWRWWLFWMWQTVKEWKNLWLLVFINNEYTGTLTVYSLSPLPPPQPNSHPPSLPSVWVCVTRILKRDSNVTDASNVCKTITNWSAPKHILPTIYDWHPFTFILCSVHWKLVLSI